MFWNHIQHFRHDGKLIRKQHAYGMFGNNDIIYNKHVAFVGQITELSKGVKHIYKMTECNICLSQFSSIVFFCFLLKILISEFAATLNDNFNI